MAKYATNSNYDNVISKIHEEIQCAQQDTTTVTRGYTFNYLNTINKIELYYASIFIKGPRDSEGFKKLFDNISKFRVMTAARQINLGEKDVRISAVEDSAYYAAWFVQQEMMDYMRENNWGKFFNDSCERLPKYGSIIVKDVNGATELVSLRAIIWDQGKKIDKSTYSDEKHEYNFDEFKIAAKVYNWDPEAVAEVMDMYEEMGQDTIQVIEHYGYDELSTLDDYEDTEGVDGEDIVLSRCMVAGVEFYDSQYDPGKSGKKAQPTVLQHVQVDSKPYLQHDWNEEEGRSLGVGVMEDMFISQEMWNDTIHLERKALHWSTKKFWQTKDPDAPDNLFSEAHTGDVFVVNSDISPISTEERNLPQYNLVKESIKSSADNQTSTYGVITGENVRGGTAFRLGALLASAANSYFAFRREQLGLFFEKIIDEFVLPGFLKAKKKGHKFMFEGTTEQMQIVAELLINAHVNDEVQKYVKANGGKYPPLWEYQAYRAKIERRVKGKAALEINLPDSFYEIMKFKVKIDISGQRTNEVDMQSLSTIIQLVASNPQIIQIPLIARLLEIVANEAGISPKTLFGIQPASTPAPMPNAPNAQSAGPVAPAAPINTQPMMAAVSAALGGGK